ncbi:MAG: isoamylase early set domain-containing protein [Salinibacter sp.]
METSDPDLLVQRLLDGDLSDTEVAPALHRIADDAEARDLLQFELRVTQDLAATRSPAPPPDFASQTVEALPSAADEAADEAPSSLADGLRSLWRSITTPVSVPVRPTYTIVTALFLGVVAWTMWPIAPPSSAPPEGTSSAEPVSSSSSGAVSTDPAAGGGGSNTVWIRFLYTNSEADSVAVAGDFNQWSPVSLTPRTVDGRTVWTGLVPVSRGKHEYQFVIDGDRWVPDPLAPETQSDGFGAQNAVLEV